MILEDIHLIINTVNIMNAIYFSVFKLSLLPRPQEEASGGGFVLNFQNAILSGHKYNPHKNSMH